jgi:hypothetical protein
MGTATKILPLKAHVAASAQAHRIGHIVGVQDGRWLVDYPDNPHPPLPARTIVHFTADAIERAAQANAEVLLLLEDQRSDLPIVIGLLTPPTTLAEDAQVASHFEAVVDGERVVIDAKDEIVLRCGEASITLRRNGRIVVRGTYVETRSKGVNRIKGGTVQIN